jgi:hypothetical protein
MDEGRQKPYCNIILRRGKVQVRSRAESAAGDSWRAVTAWRLADRAA